MLSQLIKRRSWVMLPHCPGPGTASAPDGNMLPIVQLFWLKELKALKQFPSLQTPPRYNLNQVIETIKVSKHIGPANR